MCEWLRVFFHYCVSINITVMSYKTILFIVLLISGSIIRLSSQCECGEYYGTFPATIDGIEVTTEEIGDIGTFGGAYTSSCGNTVSLAGSSLWLGINASFNLAVQFDPPVTSATFIIGGLDNIQGIDDFTILANGGADITTTAICGCLSIDDNTVTCGPCNNDGGIFQVTSSAPFTELTFDGDGGSNGFLLGMCDGIGQPTCILEVDLQETLCDDNGTASDPSDDQFFIDVVLDGTMTSPNGWTADDIYSSTGLYNTTTTLGPYSISDGSFLITFTDVDNSDCVAVLDIIPPETCSDECIIDYNLINVTCFDNNTPSDDSDDFYIAEIVVTGVNTSSSWEANDLINSTGNYNEASFIGPYPIASGDVNFSIFDGVDNFCSVEVSIEAPPTCSPECVITYELFNIVCSDNGTASDPLDDVFFFDILVTGSNISTVWLGNDINGSTGTYNEFVSLGPYPINQSLYSFDIFDASNFNCSTEVIIQTPATCSEACELDFVIENITCDDNGTALDSSDDVYFFDLTVIQENETGTWIADDINSSTGVYNVPSNIGPYIISEGELVFSVLDQLDETCILDIQLDPPPSCSEGCELSFTIIDVICDNNGTIADSTDDQYSIEIIVEGINVSGLWNANDVYNSSGSFNESVLIGPYNFIDDTLAFSIFDSLCIVPFTYIPESCAESCALTYTLSNFQCNNNGTPQDSTDNLFFVDIVVEGENVSGSWTANDGLNSTGNYNDAITLGPYDVSADTLFFNIEDSDDPSCFTDVVIPVLNETNFTYINHFGCTDDGFSVEVHSTIYDENNPSGTEFLINASGCDSIVVVQLTFSDVLMGEELYTGCTGDGYEVFVNGTMYNEENPIGTDTLISSFGCDSIVDINLIYELELEGEESYEGCTGDGYEVSVNGTVYNELNPSGIESITSASGCDSIVTIDLNYAPIQEGLFLDTLCETEHIIIQNILFDINNPSGSVLFPNGGSNGCDSILFVELTFIPTIELSIIGGGMICEGDSVQLVFSHDSPSGLNVELFDGISIIEIEDVMDGELFTVFPESSTDYSVSSALSPFTNCAISFGGAQASVVVSNVTTNAEVTSDYNGFDLSCNEAVNGSAQVVASQGIEPYAFTWSNGEDEAIVTNLGNQTYFVSVTDAIGCAAIDSITLTAPDGIEVSIFTESVLCPGENSGTIIIEEINGGVSPYQISLNGNSTQTTETLPFTFPALEVGTYDLEITDANGCLFESVYQIDEEEPLTVDLGNSFSIFSGDSIYLEASANRDIATIQWEPANLVSCDTCVTIFSNPTETTLFTVEVVDENGCIAFDSVEVRVEQINQIYIPNIFSPNEDGLNDVFYVSSGDEVSIIRTMVIYDRWGNRLFKNDNFLPNDPSEGWNGQFNDRPLNPAVFVYYIEVAYTNDRTEGYAGTITLFK